MVCQPVRFALLLGAITAVAVSPARAQEKTPAPTNPNVRTIQVTECVPETYKVKRTAYKVECRTEQYDAVRCEMVPEVRERTVVCVKRVPVNTVETRKVCKRVTEYEERVVMKSCYKYVQQTCMEKKLVRRGHWECRTECRKKVLHKDKCCDPCDPCCNTRTVTRKVWVHCPEYRECPKTVCKKVCVQEPVKCRVAVCKNVWVEEKVNVCKIQCVEEKRVEKYTVCVPKQVAYKATRNVRVCVPYEEEVTCTRMVARTVNREVAVAPCADTCCETTCRRPGLRDRLHSHHCRSRDCNSCCR